MLSSRLIQLIETHVHSLTTESMRDVLTSEHTRAFRTIPRTELELRLAALFRNLGKWITDPDDCAVREEYEHWGKLRFLEGIPLSEVLYSVILAKNQLRRFIREHGLVAFSNDRASPDELLPVELYGIFEVEHMVGEFFDRALYHLAKGYETAASEERPAA
jgi:hypothetical protein